MKKIISVVCALAVAATLSVTAFAASGTPSEIYGDPSATTSEGASNTAQSVAEDIIEAYTSGKQLDVARAAYLNDLIVENNVYVTPTITEAMRTVMFGKISDGSVVPSYNKQDGHDLNVFYANNTSLANVNMSISGSTITVNASYENNVQSDLGAIVLISMPKNQVSSAGYTWSCDGQTGDVVFFAGKDENSVGLMFYAPHFSTYTLTAKPATSNPTTDNNPIKATGADMSLSMLALAVGGSAVIGGAAVATKKFNLGK